MNDITLKDIFEAQRRIAPIALKTPLTFSEILSEHTGKDIYLKLENLQTTGSFKIRGAANALLSLSPEQKKRGVITFSTGNHGRAVAYVARKLGLKAVICLSNRVPQYRLDAMRKLGAEVVQHGESQDEAYDHALELQKKQRLTMIQAFDDPLIIAGQGTIGLEILEDLPGVDTVVVPLSGGGLIAGIALAMKTADPNIRIVGVSMEVAPAMYHCIQAAKPVEIEEKDSLADALLGGIGLDNQYTFPLVQKLVDDIILVTEDEIAEGLFFTFEQQRLVIEGAAAVGIAMLIGGKDNSIGRHTAVVLSGSNVDTALLSRIAAARYGIARVDDGPNIV
jgi:threonine dehydratase